MGQSPGRIHQPNLTCRYELLGTPDNRIRQLVVINHDDCGITDEQIVTSAWKWCQEFSKRLLKNNSNKNLGEVFVPDADGFLTWNKRATIYNIIFVSQDPKNILNDESFLVCVSTFVAGMANQLGIQLEGLNGRYKERTPNGGETRI